MSKSAGICYNKAMGSAVEHARQTKLRFLASAGIMGLAVLGAFSACGAQAAGPAAGGALPASEGAMPALAIKASDTEVEASKVFIDGMAQRAINFLADQSLAHEKKSEKFRALLSDNFDLKTIGRFALGRYWKVASPAQQQEYLSLFEKMVVDVYSNRFKDYQGQDLVVDSAKPEGDKDVLVTSFIVPDSGPKVQVDWRVRSKDGSHKIVDIIVEGVSMAVTQRSEFASIIQSGGGDIAVLIDHLRK